MDIPNQLRSIAAKLAGLEGREKYPDGRLVPVEGDKVYQSVPGFGGLPAVIHGLVYRYGKGLRVRVTATHSLIGGGGGTGKTYKLDYRWTVMDDPAIKAREEKRKADEAEKQRRRIEDERIAEETVEKEGRRRGLKRVEKASDLHPGDTVYRIQSDYAFSTVLPTGDPTKTDVEEMVVKEVFDDYFTYDSAEHGYEITSGKLDVYWRKP